MVVTPAKVVGTSLVALSAICCGSSSSVTREVEQVPATIEAFPDSANLARGASHQYTAVVRDRQGDPIPNVLVNWTSTDPTVVSLDQSGRAVANNPGTAVLRASARGAIDVGFTVVGDTTTARPPPPDTSGVEPFFFDDFETGDKTKKGETRAFAWGSNANVSVTRKHPYEGQYSLQFTFNGGGPTSDAFAEQRFSFDTIRGPAEIWREYYVYYPDGNEDPELGAAYFNRNIVGDSDGHKIGRIWGGHYGSGHFTVGFSAESGEHPNGSDQIGPSFRRADGTLVSASGGGLIPGLPGINGVPPGNMVRGDWMQIREHFLQSENSWIKNGVIQLWINGELKYDRHNLDFYHPDGEAAVFFDKGYLLGWSNAGFDEDTYVFIDNIRFYDKDPGGDILNLPSVEVGSWLLRDIARKHLVPAAAMGARVASLGTLWDPSTSLKWLMTSHRFQPREELARKIRGVLEGRPELLGPLMPNDVTLPGAGTRTLVLKAPEITSSGVRPGVILIKFTDTFRYFYHNVDLPNFLRCFHVVLEPSWAGYALPEILFWLKAPGVVVVESSGTQDREFISSLQGNLIPVPFGSSDWVNHDVFFPTDEPKTFDAVYVANYAPLKRVHVLFRAMRKITREGTPFRAALVCSSWGGRGDVVRGLIQHFGVAEQLTVFEDLDREEVNSVLNRSKCNLLLSLKEGSNRSLFEAMFANSPAVLLDENTGVNRDYINQETGMIVPEARLHLGLQEMARSFQGYRPREWALENISPEVTTRKLAQVLRQAGPGNQDFGDLLVKTNDPEAVYFDTGLGLDGRAIARRVLGAFRPGQVDAAGGLERMAWLNDILQTPDGS